MLRSSINQSMGKKQEHTLDIAGHSKNIIKGQIKFSPLMLMMLISPKKFPSLRTANSVTPSSATTASFPSLMMYISCPTSPFLQTYSPGLNICKAKGTKIFDVYIDSDMKCILLCSLKQAF